MKIESKSRKIGGSRYVLIPAPAADWIFGKDDGEDTTQFGGKKLIIEVG
jgi:hypothetical protein